MRKKEKNNKKYIIDANISSGNSHYFIASKWTTELLKTNQI